MKKIDTPSLLLGFAATIVLSSCSQSPQQSAAPLNADTPTAQPEAVEPSTNSYSVNIDEEGRALRGYDPVAYFTDGEPVEGSPELSFQWNGAEFHFATAANRDKFVSNPEQYAPANGGYCTFGIVLAKKFDGDPEVWLVHDDRLHVFLNPEVKEKFLQDEPGNLSKVAENWPIIQDKSPEELEVAG
ncbi:MAG: YHS domain-containing (seleno)protein [Cyanobacteria bacterium P01_H01_bin.58]